MKGDPTLWGRRQVRHQREASWRACAARRAWAFDRQDDRAETQRLGDLTRAAYGCMLTSRKQNDRPGCYEVCHCRQLGGSSSLSRRPPAQRDAFEKESALLGSYDRTRNASRFQWNPPERRREARIACKKRKPTWIGKDTFLKQVAYGRDQALFDGVSVCDFGF
jgi:hypothetical protein